MKTNYNKLVRDGIPDIIRESGRKCTTRVLNDEEYKKELMNKLYEEIEEFNETKKEEELADILEVLNAIADMMDYEMMHLDYLRMKKKEKRGGFEKRIMLLDVEESDK